MIALVTVASRVVGFARWVVQAGEVGPNAVGTAYATANTLPNVVFEIAAGGALAGAVVPLLAAPLARAARSDVDRVSSALLGWALLVLVPLAVVVALAARPVVRLFLGADADPAQVDVTATFLAIFAPQIPLYGVGVVLTGVLQAHRRFLAPALAPLLSSLVVIGVYVVFGALVPGPKDDLTAVPAAALAWLAWGTTAGVAVMTLPLLWPVHRAGVRLRPALAFPTGVASRARALALAGLGALVAQQVSVLAALFLANDYGDEAGTFPVFQYTQAVYFLPYAVLAVPLATATFPRLADHAARDDRPGFARLTSVTTRAVLLVAGAGAAAAVAAAPPVERAFAAIADGDVSGMAAALTWMAPGLLGFALVFHLSRALYALDRGRAAVLATGTGWLVVAAASFVLVPWLASARGDQVGTLRGLAIAGSVGMTVAGAGLLLAVARAAGREATRGVARTCAVLVAGGGVGAVLGRWVGGLAGGGLGGDDGTSLVVAVLAGVAAAVVAAAAVLAAAWGLDRQTLTVLTGARTARPGRRDGDAVRRGTTEEDHDG